MMKFPEMDREYEPSLDELYPIEVLEYQELKEEPEWLWEGENR